MLVVGLHKIIDDTAPPDKTILAVDIHDIDLSRLKRLVFVILVEKIR